MKRTGAAHRPQLRMPAWQRHWTWVVQGLLLLSGLAWLLVHELWGAGAGELPHPSESWWMKLHGLGVFGGLFGLGLLAAAHVMPGWRFTARHGQRGQRLTGLLLCLCQALLVLTAYALYYGVSEEQRSLVGYVHAALGVVMALALIWHGRLHARRLASLSPHPVCKPVGKS